MTTNIAQHTQAEKKHRAIKRLAQIFRDHWEEGRVGSTRIFEHVIPDEWLIGARSSSGGRYREHIVPCVLIRNQSIKMYQDGESIDDVAKMIERHLAIVLVSEEEKTGWINSVAGKPKCPTVGCSGPEIHLRG